MRKLIKYRKANSILTFNFLTLYSKMQHNKLRTVLNSFIDFCLYGGESKYITFNSCRAHWVKNIKDDVMCFNIQITKYALFYLLFTCYFTVGPKSSS